MRKTKAAARNGYILVLWITLFSHFASAQNKAAFELKTGDRVVFVGNALIEDDMQFGYLELALTTRFPSADVSFRNVGWSGDDVWGEARGYISQPPTAYGLLIENITKSQPTVVFIAYGGVEAQKGAAGLPDFKNGLNKILNITDSIGAKAVLLSPIPVISGDSASHLTKRNSDLQMYSTAIAQIAAERGKQFVDVYNPIATASKETVITVDGVHLNETGYYFLARAVEKGLGINDKNSGIDINIPKNGSPESAAVKIIPSEKSAIVTFKAEEPYLSVPVPSDLNAPLPSVKISGLKKGFYTLSVGDDQLVTASAKAWASGVTLKRTGSSQQVDALRDMILKKNDIFFAQYRPQNRTYILGMRAYEQGRHAKGLEELGLIVKWLEGQIALKKVPQPHIYKLTAVTD